MMFKKSIISTLITGFVFAAGTANAMQKVESVSSSCTTTEAGMKCTIVYKFSEGSSGGGPVNWTAIYYNQSTRPEVEPGSITGDLSGTREEQAEFLEDALDKTPWNQEQVADYLANTMKVREIIVALLENVNLTDEARKYLNAALKQANNQIGWINEGAQVTNHVLNEEWALAGSELLTFIVALGLEHGIALTLGATLSLSPLLTTAAATGIVIVLAPEIEAALDSYLVDLDFTGVLQELDDLIDIPILNTGSTTDESMLCAMYWKRPPICDINPIVLDIDGNGVTFIKIEDSLVKMDVNNDGIPDTISWPTSGNAVLFVDENGNGLLDNYNEFDFTRFSILKNPTDFHGLRNLDVNKDKQIDNKDGSYEFLYLWDDKNNDGISTYDEVSSLEDAGINLILKGKNKVQKEVQGNILDTTFKYKINNKKGFAGSYTFKALIGK